MKHEPIVTKVTVRMEFKCGGRIAWVESDMGMREIENPLLLKAVFDEKIEAFLKQNNPLRVH